MSQLPQIAGWSAVMFLFFSLLSDTLMYKRWLGIGGGVCFGYYAWAMATPPLLVASIVFILFYAWHLYRLYTTEATEYFQRFPINTDSAYLKLFLEFYKPELSQIYPDYSLPLGDHVISFFVLRNLVPAGIFIASEMEPKTLYVHVDFAIPRFRDYKIARYMYEQQADFFLEKDYTTLWTVSKQLKHTQYLSKMGFKPRSIEGRIFYVKDLKRENGKEEQTK